MNVAKNLAQDSEASNQDHHSTFQHRLNREKRKREYIFMVLDAAYNFS